MHHRLIAADVHTRDLSRIHSYIRAESGENGQSRCCSGKQAPHLTIKVGPTDITDNRFIPRLVHFLQLPVGTVIRHSGAEEVLADLSKSEQIFLAARGGAGGRGNHYYLSNESRAPTKGEWGAPGEKVRELCLPVR